MGRTGITEDGESSDSMGHHNSQAQAIHFSDFNRVDFELFFFRTHPDKFHLRNSNFLLW
jgi:hypothetical protein